jgi:error-prone DNA polymerase
VRAPRSRHDLFDGVELGDEKPALPPLGRAERLVLDYQSTGLSVDDHPMKLVRADLPRHIKSARDIASIPHGTRVSTAGLVICRQRPGTASGVVFITLEDETGFINLILYARVFDEHRHVATTSSLLCAHGKIERDGDVVYVIPTRLERLDVASMKTGHLPTMSRDFH